MFNISTINAKRGNTSSVQNLSRYRCLVLIVSFLWFACAPKPAKPPSIPPDSSLVKAPIAAGAELFARAEKLLAEKRYSDALNAFNEYLHHFSAGPFADRALMHAGTIYMVMEDFEKSRNAYARLLREHPESPLSINAKIEILFTYYHEGKYNEVLSQAPDIKKDQLSPGQTVRVNRLLGDTYTALGSFVDTVFFYAKAYHGSDSQGREKIIPIIKTAISKLDMSGIITLLGSLDGAPPSGYLMYQLGLNQVRDGNFDAAIAVLSSLIEKFPEHENLPQAKIFLEELIKDYAFNRYTIGCLLPLTGPYRAYGHRALQAIELAFVQFTSKTPNPDLKIIIKDTGSDPDKSVQGVRELIKENAAAIIGPLTSIETAAMEAQDKGIPIITMTQKDYITEIGDFVFRNFITPKMQVKTLLSFAVQELGLTRFAILYPDEHYGKTFMNLFWDEVIAQGASVVGVESYHVSKTDFADPIKKLVGLYYEVPEDLRDQIKLIAEKLVNDDVSKEEGDLSAKKGPDDEKPQAIVDFDAVFIPDAPKKVGLIIPQLAFYDVNDVYLFGTNLWNSDELIKMAQEYIQNAIIPAGFFPDSSSAPVSYFVRGFQETFGQKPKIIEAIFYDSAMMLFQLTSRADPRSRTALKNALARLKNYQGVTGLTSFEPSGDVQKKLYLLGIRGDKFVELEHQK